MVQGADYEDMKCRQERCVCKQCGSKLEIRMVIFCQYGGQGLELFCPQCQRVEYGIEQEIYEYAKHFVNENEFNYFVDMAEDERNTQLNVSKVGEIFGWLFREMSLCNENGLTKNYKKIQI